MSAAERTRAALAELRTDDLAHRHVVALDDLRAAGWTLHPPHQSCTDVLAARQVGKGARRTDPATSKAADRVMVHRAGSQIVRLLAAYRDHAACDGATAEQGLTDSEARAIADLPVRSCYWKRCSVLRAEGLIAPVEVGPDGATPFTRPDVDTGEPRIVCTITPAGRTYLERVMAP